MRNVFIRLTFSLLFFGFFYSANAQNNFWKDVLESKISTQKQRKPAAQKYRTLQLDTASLRALLKTIPKEFSEAAKKVNLIVTLPMPDGSYSRFRIEETSAMAPELAAKFPGIKTYNGQGIDDPYATVKADWSELGFHAMILSPVNGSVFIDPYSVQTLSNYISYFKKDVTQRYPFLENGKVLLPDVLSKPISAARGQEAQCIGGTLRTYRLAVACTGEYAAAVGGTAAKTLAAIVTTINRVNGIYENELDIRMVLVNNNNKIVYTDSTKDPFTGNDDAQTLITESQSTIDDVIGSKNYDIGHTFSTGSGGLAEVGVVCIDGSKASGVTGNNPPVGDPFDIDYVAHEMGHEFGANHTFNAATGNCEGNGDASANAEPGSGSTIMGYAGICDRANDLQPNSDPQFHAISFNEITDYITNGNGSDCAVKTSTGNTPPVVNAGSNYTIPKSTPFALTGSATDVNKDALTYSWEEVNVGGPNGNWNQPRDNAPIFRSFPPSTSPVRYFPKMNDILNNSTTIGEILPSYSRTLNFRLTVRDNRSGGGGVCFDESSVIVDGASGPFRITNPDTATTWDAGTFKNITWSVNNTNNAPVNCANVAIDLSTNGGQTFPIVLLASTPNDGLEEIVVPENITTAARIRVRAIGNVFFDISNKNFKIQPFVFTAQKDANNTITAKWQTTNELGNIRYEIERSIDRTTFETIGNVPSGSNPDSVQTYSFNDNKPYQATNFYRLKMLDAAGNFTYSKVVSVALDKTGVQYTIFPNPATNQTGVRVLAEMKEVTVRLINALGQRVFLKSFGEVSIGQEIQLPLVGLSRGIYILTVSSNEGITSHKIMVQ